MDALDQLPRLPARPAVLAVAALAGLAGCVSPGPVLRQFGVVGTFAEDCSRAIAQGGARAIYDVPPPGYGDPTFTAVNRYGTFRTKIVRADRIDDNTLIMYFNDPGGAWSEVDIRKSGNGFITTKMVSHRPNQYRPLVAIGDRRPGGNSGEGLFVEKCSDAPIAPAPLSAERPQ